MLDAGSGTPLYCETCFQELLGRLANYECNCVTKKVIFGILDRCNSILNDPLLLSPIDRLQELNKILQGFWINIGGDKR